MWKKFLVSASLISLTIYFCSPTSANDNSNRICTKTQGSSVSLRTGPGTNYSRGLVEVGSGGDAVNNYFRQRNYTVSDGEQISIFSSTRGTDGRTWHRVGTNQWVAWVRSDFVCRRS